MAGRPGFFGGIRQDDAPERGFGGGFGSGPLTGGSPVVRFGDPNGGRPEPGFGTPPGFDPVWGTLGAPAQQGGDDWGDRRDEAVDGQAVDVEILGNGFQISGRIQTGQFERLSDWLNVQSGFIQVRDAAHVNLGRADAVDPGQRRGTLFVRLDQVVMVAERSAGRTGRSGGLVVQKQPRRVSIVTPGYHLKGNIHLVAYGSMTQFLESPDPHFLPITDVTVSWLSDAALAARFPFAVVNRDQLVTVLDESEAPAGDSAQASSEAREDDMPLHRRWGAA
jgi:hypothetical protein